MRVLQQGCLTKTKTSEARQVPVNDDLVGMFEQIKAEQNHKGNVIAIDGKPAKVLQLNTYLRLRAKRLMGLSHHKKKAVNLLNGLTAKSFVLQKPD